MPKISNFGSGVSSLSEPEVGKGHETARREVVAMTGVVGPVVGTFVTEKPFVLLV
jgi:hypothetical protein